MVIIPRKHKKKTRKKRGSRTIGYGRVGQHRKTGQRAGRGKTTQWKKSKKSYYLKQKELGFPDPDWEMGKRGFKRPQDVIRRSKVNTINVKDLDLDIDNYLEKDFVEKSGKTYTINLEKMNIQKVLGRGNVTKKLNITVEKASKRAVEKIEEAGGKVTLISESE
ncbi:MAG: uL15 family ribosomal protein [Candidatus Lokiarchaeota archaeon]